VHAISYPMWDPYAQHYWAWCVDIYGGWPDSGNLIAGDPTDLGGGLDTILEFVVGPTQPHKSGLWGEDHPHL